MPRPTTDVENRIRRISHAADILFLREQDLNVAAEVGSDVLCSSMLLDAAALLDHYSAVPV